MSYRTPLALGLIAILVSALAQAHAGEAMGVSSDERQALISLYQATDGMHWDHSDGWLEEPGTECTWYGVRCDHRAQEPATVVMLELSENNLRGSIPVRLGDLSALRELDIVGNYLTGMLPEPLLRRWRTGELFVAAAPSLLTDVSEIDYEFSPSALLCARRRIIMLSDGSAVQFTEKCRNRTRDDRATYCEVRHGEIWPGEFPKLAWVLERNGVYSFLDRYDRNVTDGAFESTRVNRGKERHEVIDYAEAGPLELWMIHRAIEGLASTADWQKTERQAECPRWNETSSSSEPR